jgi:tetratricopeptide (TPR) repeat protein
LTDEQINKLSEFASRTVDLLVKRRNKLRRRVEDKSEKWNEGLLRHAGVATNLGGLLYNLGEYVTAMKLYQESVQTLMLFKDHSSTHQPSRERQAEMSNLLTMMGAEADTDSSRVENVQLAKQLMKSVDEDATYGGHPEDVPPIPPTSGIPGLYGHDSNFKGMERRELGELVFSEPFRITVNEAIDTVEHFIIPLDQCSKATLFNMGLIHYHWGNSDTAMQFFDLASSLSQQLSPLSFDPVILGAFNNMAQIHLQYRRTNDAMELLKDACTRGNAALTALCTTEEKDANFSAHIDDYIARRSRRLRRKLARTVLNLGRVHFINSEYDAAMATCQDAIRLLQRNSEDPEMAAVYHNIAVIYYHKGNMTESLENLDTFLQRAKPIIGPDHLQIAEAMHDKGVTLFEMGKLDESMVPLQEALRIRRLRLGQNHVSVAESLCLIGKVLVSQEKYESGLNAYQEGLGVYRQIAGSEPLSFDVAQILLDIGRVLQAQGHMEQAIKSYEEATEMTQKFFGANHPFVARLYNILGNLHNEVGQADKSEKSFEEARRIMAQNKIPYNSSTVQDPLVRVSLPQNPMPPNR